MYNYDPVGNRLMGPKETDSYTYNPGNELVTSHAGRIIDKDRNYTYDAKGNLVKKAETLRNKLIRTTTYAYDDENRLIRVTIEKGRQAREVSFAYDPLGRRISRTVHRDTIDDDEDGTSGQETGKKCDKGRTGAYPRTTHYVYDGPDIIAEYDQDWELTARYIHGPSIDEPLSAEIRRSPGRSFKRIYYHADGLGSITALTAQNPRLALNFVAKSIEKPRRFR